MTDDLRSLAGLAGLMLVVGGAAMVMAAFAGRAQSEARQMLRKVVR